MLSQALVESGVDGKESEGESKDKYESHTQVSDLTIIFANTRMILVKRTKASVDWDNYKRHDRGDRSRGIKRER